MTIDLIVRYFHLVSIILMARGVGIRLVE